MEHLCLRDEELADAAALPADSPARDRWRACARCRARVAAYREFMNPSVAAAGPEWDAADGRMAAVLDAEIHGRPVEGKTPAGARIAPAGEEGSPEQPRQYRQARDAQGGPTDRPIQGFFRWLFSPSLRPVTALAALVVVLAAVQGIRIVSRHTDDAIVLREGANRPSVSLTPGEVTRLPGGALSLSWNPVEGADRYEVALYGEDLIEKKRYDAAKASSLTIPADEVIALAGSTWAPASSPAPSTGPAGSSGQTVSTPPESSMGGGAPLFWRVIASRQGDIISQSRIRPLRTSAR